MLILERTFSSKCSQIDCIGELDRASENDLLEANSVIIFLRYRRCHGGPLTSVDANVQQTTNLASA